MIVPCKFLAGGKLSLQFMSSERHCIEWENKIQENSQKIIKFEWVNDQKISKI